MNYHAYVQTKKVNLLKGTQHRGKLLLCCASWRLRKCAPCWSHFLISCEGMFNPELGYEGAFSEQLSVLKYYTEMVTGETT